MLFIIYHFFILMLCKMSALLFIFIICAPTVFTQNWRSTPQHYCYVPSPIDNSVFNFSAMQNEHVDSTIRINDVDYLRVHFCRPLENPCNGKQDYAVCLHANDKEIGVGKEPPKVTYKFGKITFKYTGDKCNKTHNYTVDIEMKCNFSIEKIDAELDIVYDRHLCGFTMAIETSAACAKEKQTSCEFTDETGSYNLSPLMDLASNYMIKLNNSLSIILNVCHSLIYGQHYKDCDHNTMVCLVNRTNTEEPSYTRLGNLNDYMHFSTNNGSVYLDLTSDTPCDKDLTKVLNSVRTTIEFVCDEDTTNKLPEYISGIGTCHYKFRWRTIAACNESILIKHSKVNHQACKITDPMYNELFDLSVLEGRTMNGKSQNQKAKYEFRICGPLENNEKGNCSKFGTGVCKYAKGQNIGVSKGLANTNLMWRRNQIFLNYTDGVACGSNQRSYTLIIFECSHVETLFIIDSDPCITIITWFTTKVCKHRCASSDDKLNLQNLRRGSRNYHVRGESDVTEYHLNVCEPLTDEDYTNCTYGTGICKVIVNDEGKRISELSLGYPEPGVHKAEDGRIYMRYLNGSVCEEDNSKRISSEITFTCDVDMNVAALLFLGLGRPFFTSKSFDSYTALHDGTPAFNSYNNCKYDFMWSTAFVCTDHNAGMIEGCLVNHRLEFFNLTDITEYSSSQANTSESSGSLNIRSCGEMHKCNGTFICDNRPYNENDFKPKSKRKQKIVAFQFVNESQCKNDIYYNSVIKEWCLVWGSVGESFLLKEDECGIELDWTKHNTVCKPKIIITEGVKVNDSSSVSTTACVILIIIAAILSSIVLAIAVYLYRHKDKAILCARTTRNYISRYVSFGRESEPIVNLFRE